MTHPSELVGLWSSDPYDYGVMESTDLALLADGSGWSAMRNVAGVLQVRRLRWDSPAPGVLELAYAICITGRWWMEGGEERAEVEESEADDERIRAQYGLKMDVTGIGGEPFAALWLSELVDFAGKFGLGRRSVSAADDPMYGFGDPSR